MTESNVTEECVNVDRRWLGTYGVRVRILAAGLVLLAAGCVFLGAGSRSRQIAAKEIAAKPGELSPGAISVFENQPAGLFAALGHSPAIPSHAPARTETSASSFLMASLPLIFEPNRGQANLDPTDARARFISHGSGYALLLGSEGAIINLRSKRATFESIRMKLAGANPNANLTATDILPGKSNYFLGGDPAKWRSHIPQFARVRYENVYPGINLVFYGKQGHLEYDFQVAPGADPSRAELEFDGAHATSQKDGSILIERKGVAMRLQAPRVYQTIAGRERPVEGRFVLRGSNRAGFALGTYDRTRDLVIDPVLSFSTYFGGSGDETATSVAVDSSANIYLAGATDSNVLPMTTGFFQPTLKSTPPNTNVYIAKIDPTINPPVFVYVTYLGGTGSDAPVGIAVDGLGDAFVAGTTSSVDFPHTSTAYQTAPETPSTGTQHVFVTELNPAATSLQYSTYLSGNGTDLASGMTIDTGGNAYVTGTTTSSDAGANGSQFPAGSLPVSTPLQSIYPGVKTFFVTKVNTANAGSASIAYSTYFGGSNTAGGVAAVATGGGIAVDTNGNMYFDGTTNVTYTDGQLGDFPILNAYQPCLNQPPPVTVTNPPVCGNLSSAFTDAFAAKINPVNVQPGEQLQWSTFFGGTQNDSATGIAIDPGATHIFIVGTTNSPGIVPGTGTANTAPFQICLDTPQNPLSGTCPTIAATPTPSDAFVASLSNPAATTTTNMVDNYFSYLGGSGNEEGLAITVDSGDNAYLTGWTQSSGTVATAFPVFPPPGDLQGSLQGAQDAFIARLNTTTANGQNTSGAFTSYFGGSVPATALTQGTGIALDVNANTYFAGNTNSTNLEVNALQQNNAGGFDAFVSELRTVSDVTITGLLALGTNQTFISAGTPATFTYTITNLGPDPANNLTFSDNFIESGVTFSNVAVSSSQGQCSGIGTTPIVSCSLNSLEAGSIATVTVSATPTSTGNTANGGTGFNGGTATVTGPNILTPPNTTVTALMSDYSLEVTPPNYTVNEAGAPASFQVQLRPLPVYTSNISLSCTGLGTGMACNFVPSNTVSLPSASPGAALLSVTTTARPITTASARHGMRNLYAIWLFVPGLSLLGLGVRTRGRRRVLGFLMLCGLFTQLLLLPACSGSTTQIPVAGTPSGTYKITVSSSAGTDSKSFTVQVTVP